MDGKKINFQDMSVQSIMRQWDYYRMRIINGDRSSAPRDWFEALIDYFKRQIGDKNDD